MAVDHKYTVAQIAELRSQFNAFDKDGSGSISAEELKVVLQNVGMDASNEVVLEMIRVRCAQKDTTMTQYNAVFSAAGE